MSAERHILVLLHPFPMDASFWGPMWRELDAGVTVLTPEFPGFGAAPPVAAPSIAGFADEVAALIAAEAAGPATVAGLSLGGYVALALVRSHPELVAGLVLAGTRATADTADQRAARDRGIDTVRIDGLHAYLDGLVPRLLAPDAPPEAVQRACAIAESQDPDAVIAALEALRDRPDRSAELAAIAVPTTVVAGGDDAVIPPGDMRELAAGIPGARYLEIAGAGHLSALERPAAFAAAVAGALGQRVPA